ncbi:hypothetical protein PR048_007748 [Dryococelus australis]|uniref:Uncharacterized protein n=1 Tax=Dryococelus australis TaxID=614101 RepID=A0ABQ9HW02_9NEOP|nr:hypothetical protein PR048_007748 [Dryococelus australis]
MGITGSDGEGKVHHSSSRRLRPSDKLHISLAAPHRLASGCAYGGQRADNTGHGSTVVERLACLLPTKAIPEDAVGRRVFSRISHPPRLLFPALHHTSITLIGSQDLDAEKRGSDKGDNATFIKCAIAAKSKALNWRAPIEGKLVRNYHTPFLCVKRTQFTTTVTATNNSSVWMKRCVTPLNTSSRTARSRKRRHSSLAYIGVYSELQHTRQQNGFASQQYGRTKFTNHLLEAKLPKWLPLPIINIPKREIANQTYVAFLQIHAANERLSSLSSKEPPYYFAAVSVYFPKSLVGLPACLCRICNTGQSACVNCAVTISVSRRWTIVFSLEVSQPPGLDESLRSEECRMRMYSCGKRAMEAETGTNKEQTGKSSCRVGVRRVSLYQTALQGKLRDFRSLSNVALRAALVQWSEASPHTEASRGYPDSRSQKRDGRCHYSVGFLGVFPFPRPCIPPLIQRHFT